LRERDIAGDGQEPVGGNLPGDLRPHALGRFRVHIHDGHVGAVLGQSAAEPVTENPSAARHDRRLAG
jgi:hypothetical protein